MMQSDCPASPVLKSEPQIQDRTRIPVDGRYAEEEDQNEGRDLSKPVTLADYRKLLLFSLLLSATEIEIQMAGTSETISGGESEQAARSHAWGGLLPATGGSTAMASLVPPEHKQAPVLLLKIVKSGLKKSFTMKPSWARASRKELWGAGAFMNKK